jgi:hypothetical protein
VVNVATREPARSASRGRGPAVSGLVAVRRGLPFTLRAPARLAGVSLTSAHRLGRDGALLVYGDDLGGIAVVEKRAASAQAGGAGSRELRLRGVRVGNVAGQAVVTPLGTLVRFSRGGVDYTVVGLVRQSVALAAARGL